MDIQFFQTFLMVAKLGNMTQAADRLNFTQPTVTGQIRSLERHFGAMLFERVGKKLYITEAGRKLIDYSERIVAAYNEAQEALVAYPGSIDLGVSTSMVNYLLLPVLQEFQSQVPKCSVTVEMCINPATVIKGVLENRFDLGFVQHKVAEKHLMQFEILKEQLVWAAHRKVVEKYRYSTDITDYPILVYKSGGFFRGLYEKILEGKNFNSIIEYTDSEVLKKAVLDGLGFGTLPLVMIKPFLDDGTLVEFGNMPRLDFGIWLILHKDKVLSRPAKNFFNLVRENRNFADESPAFP